MGEIFWHDTRGDVQKVDIFHHDLADLIQELRGLEDGYVNTILNKYNPKVTTNEVQGLKVKFDD